MKDSRLDVNKAIATGGLSIDNHQNHPYMRAKAEAQKIYPTQDTSRVRAQKSAIEGAYENAKKRNRLGIGFGG